MCRYSAATRSAACSSTSCRRGGAGQLARSRSGAPSPRSPPRRAQPPCRGAVRVAERPHRRDRLRGAERQVDPAAPGAVAPARRSHRPLRGWRPSISAMKSGPSTAPPSMPRRASVSGEASHRPGACVGSPPGRGSSRRALAPPSLTPGSGRTRRPWRRRCSMRSSHPIQTTTPRTGQRIAQRYTALAQGVHLVCSGCQLVVTGCWFLL